LNPVPVRHYPAPANACLADEPKLHPRFTAASSRKWLTVLR